MADYSRRSFLQLSGGALGIAAAPTITSASETDRYLVDTQPLSEKDLNGGGLTVITEIPEIDLAVVSGAESDVKRLGTAYAPDIEYELATPTDGAEITAEDSETTDEPLYDFQWDKQVQDLETVHEHSRGEGTRVAVIDTGIASHPDLEHALNADLSRNFTLDDEGAPGAYGGRHGTHVAGIIAANDQNDAGVVGTAPGTELVDCRTFSETAPTTFGMILASIVYSANIGADVANLSLGAYPVPRPGLGKLYGKAMNRTTAYANQNDVLLVASAGNQSADLQHDTQYIALPAEAANVMCVSATGPVGNGWGEPGLREDYTSPARYTNYGTNAIDIAAPGGDYDPSAIGTDALWYYDLVLSTVPGGYQFLAGTSMAAPQVSGGAAVLKSDRPQAPATRIRSTLEQAAEDVGDPAYYGAGFIDLVDALDR